MNSSQSLTWDPMVSVLQWAESKVLHPHQLCLHRLQVPLSLRSWSLRGSYQSKVQGLSLRAMQQANVSTPSDFKDFQVFL